MERKKNIPHGGLSNANCSHSCSPEGVGRGGKFPSMFTKKIYAGFHILSHFCPLKLGGVGGGGGLEVREKRKLLLRKEFHLFWATELGDSQFFGFRVRVLHENFSKLEFFAST